MHLRQNESADHPGMTEAQLTDYYLGEAACASEEEREYERDLVGRILRRLIKREGILVVVTEATEGQERLVRVHPNYIPGY